MAGPDVYRQQWRRGYKPYHCDECSGEIRRGQLHSYVTGRWELKWGAFRECLKCWAIRQAWADLGGQQPRYGCLIDEVLEPLRDCPERDLNRRFGMRLRAHLGKYGPQLPVRSKPVAAQLPPRARKLLEVRAA